MASISIKDGAKVIQKIISIIESYKPTGRRIFGLLNNKSHELRRHLLNYFSESPSRARELLKFDPLDNALFSWESPYLKAYPEKYRLADFYDVMLLINFIVYVMDEAQPSEKKLKEVLADAKSLKDLFTPYFEMGEEYIFSVPSANKPSEPEVEVFPVVVDYNKPVQQMAIEAGFYRLSQGVTNKHFRVLLEDRKEKVDLTLMPYEGDLLALRESLPNSAGLTEILSFAKLFPQRQCQRPIVQVREIWPRSTGPNFFVLGATSCNKESRKRLGQIINQENYQGDVLVFHKNP